MFQGETAITVDDKGRMAVPTAYRDLARASNNRLVLTYNPFEAGCLWLYAESEWERVRDDVMSKPNTQRVVRLLQQKLVGSAHLELDGNGRISIPPATAVRWALKRRRYCSVWATIVERAGASGPDPADVV